MLKIRLQRVGRKNIKTFRVVLTESKNSTKSGKYLEVLGIYDPVNNVKKIDETRVKYWLSQGVVLTGTVHNFLVDQKIIPAKKVNVLPVKSKTKKRKEIKSAPAEKKENPSATAVAPAEGKIESKETPSITK